jgi:hypothetical protein
MTTENPYRNPPAPRTGWTLEEIYQITEREVSTEIMVHVSLNISVFIEASRKKFAIFAFVDKAA